VGLVTACLTYFDAFKSDEAELMGEVEAVNKAWCGMILFLCG
jgi:hypothetical protein